MSQSFFVGLKADAIILALAGCPSLESTDLPLLSVDIFSRLKQLPGGSFPRLKEVRVTTPETCIEKMWPEFLKLRTLNIVLSGSSFTALQACAMFKNLHRLSILTDKGKPSIVKGTDLITLAESCSGLRMLHIKSRPGRPSRAEGITDGVINQLAELLPDLRYLRLDLEGTYLTEESLSSLGQHCPLLTLCAIHAKVRFRRLIDRFQRTLFPCLHHLAVYAYSDLDQEREAEDVNTLAEGLLQLAPGLNSILVEGSPYWRDTEVLENTLHNIKIRRRRYAVQGDPSAWSSLSEF